MLKTLKEHYFSDRNYALLYAHGAFKASAFINMGLFTGGWLYSIGLEAHWIVAYYAAFFTMMGLFSPLSAYVSNKYGGHITFIFGFACLFVSSLFLAMAEKTMHSFLSPCS